jgi:hypothetical protein
MFVNNKSKMSLKKFYLKNGINFGIVKASFKMANSGKIVAKYVTWLDGSKYDYKQFTSERCLECNGTTRRTTIQKRKDKIIHNIGDKCNVCLGTGCANWKRNQSVSKEQKKGKTNYKNLLAGEVYYYAMDTYNFAVLDKDHKEDFAKHFEDILEVLRDAPTIKSRTKRLPHYLIKLNGENIPTRTQFLNYKKECVADLLQGQAAWYRLTDKVYNNLSTIPVFNFEDFEKYSNPYWNMDKKTNPPNITNQIVAEPIVNNLPTTSSIEPTIEGENYEWDKEFVRELLSIIDIKYWEDTKSWLQIIYNLKWCYGEKAFDLFKRFSGIASNYCESSVSEYWNKITPSYGHVNNLYKLAKTSNRSRFYYFIKKHHLPMSLLEFKKEPFSKKQLKFLCSRLQRTTKLENYFSDAEKDFESDAERKMYAKKISEKFKNHLCEYLNNYLFIVNGSQRLYFFRDYDDEGNEIPEREVNYKNKSEMIENWDLFAIENEFIKYQPVSKLWLNYEFRMTYDKYVFEPAKDFKYDIDEYNVYNSWDGWCVKYDKNFVVDEDEFKKIKYHFKNVLFNNDERCYEHWIRCFKMMLIGRKSGIGLGLSSGQGTGKNRGFDYLGHKILGSKYYSYFNNLGDLTNKFTSMRCGKVLCVCDELGTWSGDNDTACDLKGMITNIDAKKELKGKDAIMVKDFTNYVFFSNFENFLKVEGKGDRRYMIGEVDETVKGNKKYFDELSIDMGFDLKGRNLTEDEKVAAKLKAKHFFHYIMNKDLVGFNPEKIPKTRLRVNQEKNSVPVMIKFGAWLVNLLKHKHYQNNLNDYSCGPKKYNHYGIKLSKVYDAYDNFCDEFGHTNKFFKKNNYKNSMNSFSKNFSGKLYKFFFMKRINENNTSYSYVLFTNKEYEDDETWLGNDEKHNQLLTYINNNHTIDSEIYNYVKHLDEIQSKHFNKKKCYVAEDDDTSSDEDSE